MSEDTGKMILVGIQVYGLALVLLCALIAIELALIAAHLYAPRKGER